MGTSLFDPAPRGPLPDPIAALLESLRQGIPMSGAHQLPAMVSTASPLPRNLPAVVSHAPHVQQSSPLPAMHSYAPPPPTTPAMPSAITSLLATLTNAQMPGMSTTPGAPPSSGLLASGPGSPPPGAPGSVAQAGAPNGPPPSAPGGMANVPDAGPMPTIQAPPQPPGLLHHIISNLTGGGGQDSSKDAPSGAAVGYAGLLSPDEIRGARLGFFDKLATATPGSSSAGDIYRDRLDHIVKMKQVAAQTAEAQRVMGARREMATRFPLPDNPSIDDIRTNLAKQYAWAMAHGDEETVKDVGSRLSSIFAAPKPEVNHVLTPGGALVDPSGKVLYQSPSAEHEADYTQYIDPQGNVHPLKKSETPPPGWKPVTLSKTEITVQAAADRAATAATRAETARSDKAVKDYTAQIKPLRDRAAVIDQAVKTIGDAAHNPDPAVRKTLYTSAIANFIQAADQKAQIRWQLLNYYKDNVDPSIGGKWEVLKSRLLNGSLPQYSMQGMLTHLSNIRDLVHNEIDTQRAGLVKRRPELESALPQTDEFFPSVNSGNAVAPTAKGGSDIYSKYGLTPKKP